MFYKQLAPLPPLSLPLAQSHQQLQLVQQQQDSKIESMEDEEEAEEVSVSECCHNAPSSLVDGALLVTDFDRFAIYLHIDCLFWCNYIRSLHLLHRSSQCMRIVCQRESREFAF